MGRGEKGGFVHRETFWFGAKVPHFSQCCGWCVCASVAIICAVMNNWKRTDGAPVHLDFLPTKILYSCSRFCCAFFHLESHSTARKLALHLIQGNVVSIKVQKSQQKHFCNLLQFSYRFTLVS